MKFFRIYYKLPGMTSKSTPCKTIEAPTADKAIEILKANLNCAEIIAIFAE